MTTLWSRLLHHQLVHRGTTVVQIWFEVAVQGMGIALRAPRLERWGSSIRRRLAGLTAFVARSVAAGSMLRATLKEARETRRQLDVVTTTIEHLRRMEGQYHALTANYAQAQSQLETATSTIAHLRRMEAHYEALAQIDEAARHGVQAFVDEFQRILFESPDTTPQSRSAAVLIRGAKPVYDTIATLVNLSESKHGARPFQYILPFLAPAALFPLSWPAHLPPMRIVDVGSQQLDFESDVFAPLRRVAPMEVMGFDPFMPLSDAAEGAMEVCRPDGGTVKTYPLLLGNGDPVTFHINRFDATSSTFPTNHDITQHFGLLDLSLETVKTQQLPSCRLDDTPANAYPVDLLKVDVQGASLNVLAHGRAVLAKTLVCHIEVEFAPVYIGEHLFSDVDALLRDAGFVFVDFFSLGRQRYSTFESSPTRAFHRGRTLWADCIYIRALDAPEALTADQLFRQALIMHACYNKQDLAAELLRRSDLLSGGALCDAYLSGIAAETRDERQRGG